MYISLLEVIQKILGHMYINYVTTKYMMFIFNELHMTSIFERLIIHTDSRFLYIRD